MSRLVSLHLRWRVTSVRTSAILELASSFSRIHQLPRLETVNLMFYGKWFNPDCKGRLALQESILGALAASFSVRAPSKLTSLSLHNLYPSALSSLDSPPFQTVLTTLRQLRLFMILDRALGLNTALDHWCHFWGTLCTRIFLAPTQQSLTELTLHSDVYVGALSELSLHALHFPHLYALSLRNLVFEPSVGAEYFILRHAPTLMRLELITCKLPIDTNRSLYSSPSLSSPPSTTLPKCEESSDGSGCWDRIWDRFAAELIALVVLHVDERRRDPWGDTLECRYVDPGPGVSYCEANALEPRNVADAEALRHFRMIIAARSEEMHGES